MTSPEVDDTDVPSVPKVSYNRSVLAMLGRFWNRLSCRTIAPLLVPYSENQLEERVRTRVVAHLDRCPECRAELTALSAMGDFFRANPPTPAAPANDLWAKLEAQIQAEAVPVRSIARPVVTSPAQQWLSFLRSFSQAGVVVAAFVFCLFFVLNKAEFGKHQKTTAKAQLAAVSAEKITIILPSSQKHKPSSKVIVANVARPTPTVAGRVVAFAKAPAVRRHSDIEVSAPKKQVIAATVAPTLPRVVAMVRDAVPHAYAFGLEASHPTDEQVEKDLIRPASWVSEESETVSATSTVDAASDVQRQQTLFSYGGR